MVKICFNRKNKVLHSAFTTKPVMKLLSENLRTAASLGIVVCCVILLLLSQSLPVYLQDSSASATAADDDGPSASSGNGLEAIKRLIENVLETAGLKDKRPSKMDVDDFLL